MTDLPHQAEERHGVFMERLALGNMHAVTSSNISIWVMLDEGRLKISIPPSLRGQTSGLCGVFDDRQVNEFTTPEGDVEANARVFVTKWQSQPKCPPQSEVSGLHLGNVCHVFLCAGLLVGIALIRQCSLRFFPIVLLWTMFFLRPTFSPCNTISVWHYSGEWERRRKNGGKHVMINTVEKLNAIPKRRVSGRIHQVSTHSKHLVCVHHSK